VSSFANVKGHVVPQVANNREVRLVQKPIANLAAGIRSQKSRMWTCTGRICNGATRHGEMSIKDETFGDIVDTRFETTDEYGLLALCSSTEQWQFGTIQVLKNDAETLVLQGRTKHDNIDFKPGMRDQMEANESWEIAAEDVGNNHFGYCLKPDVIRNTQQQLHRYGPDGMPLEHGDNLQPVVVAGDTTRDDDDDDDDGEGPICNGPDRMPLYGPDGFPIPKFEVSSSYVPDGKPSLEMNHGKLSPATCSREMAMYM